MTQSVRWAATILAWVVIALGQAQAHSFTYIGPGPAALPAGDAEPDVLGATVISLEDDFAPMDPISGLYCQNFDGDASCGEEGEPLQAFCAELELVAGDNWDPDFDIFVFVGYPFGGVPQTLCIDMQPGSTGTLSHSN